MIFYHLTLKNLQQKIARMHTIKSILYHNHESAKLQFKEIRRIQFFETTDMYRKIYAKILYVSNIFYLCLN